MVVINEKRDETPGARSAQADLILSLSSALTSRNVGQLFLTEVIQRLSALFGLEFVMVCDFDQVNYTMCSVRIMANGDFQENFSYSLKGTPCAEVVDSGAYSFPDGVQALFPADVMLQEMNVEGYVGHSLLDASGNTIGIVAVLSCSPLKNSETILSALEMISGRVSAELMHMRLDEKLAKINKFKSDFLAIISHELRTPMHGVMGFSEVLEGTNLDEQQKEYLSLLRSSATNLLSVLNDILDFTALDKKETKIEWDNFNLLDFVEDLRDTWSIQARGRELEFSIVLGDNLPTTVLSDYDRLRRAVSNLLNNAFKFTERGIVTFSVEVDEEFLRFEVRDTGIGIDAGEFNHLFDAFQQVDGTLKRCFGGTGLGLATSKKLINLMGGDIGVESAPGDGSVFWVTVPNSQEELDEEYVGEIQKQDRKTTQDLNGVRVLIVEDNVASQAVMRTLISAQGGAVEIANCGEGALKRLEHQAFDIVLMDIQMPEMDGIETTRNIRTLKNSAATVPIIALTANAMPGDEAKYLAADMNGYITKPVDTKALFSTILKVCGRS